ncbi:MAG: 50S ribosomal protein L9 [Gammaproteobacteria bacterium]|nr:50S ribosomal protein L9 [Gammaproteobacteria bacterium]
MEVILLEPIQNLGELGDLVKVKAGYARNYLIPQGKAAPATEENRARLEQRRTEFEDAAATRLDQAKRRAEQLDGLKLEIARKTTEQGTLFGSVSPADIADAASAKGFELAKAEIVLPEGPLKELGDHSVAVSLHPEVTLTVDVSVIADQ